MPGLAQSMAVVAQQAGHAARALTLTALVLGLGAALLVFAVAASAARRRWMRHSERRAGASERTKVVDAWAESGRRLTGTGPNFAREALDAGSDDDTVDFDPDDPEDGGGRKR